MKAFQICCARPLTAEQAAQKMSAGSCTESSVLTAEQAAQKCAAVNCASHSSLTAEQAAQKARFNAVGNNALLTAEQAAQKRECVPFTHAMALTAEQAVQKSVFVLGILCFPHQWKLTARATGWPPLDNQLAKRQFMRRDLATTLNLAR